MKAFRQARYTLSGFSHFLLLNLIFSCTTTSLNSVSDPRDAATPSLLSFNVWKTTMRAPASESGRCDATVQPRGTVWGQNTSFPSSDNSPAPCISPIKLSINSTSPCNPTQEQAQAIAVLRNHHNSDIIAWHTLSQSTEPGLRHQEGPGGLSVAEIHAISTLRGCSKGSLIQWLGSCTHSTEIPSKAQAADGVDSKAELLTKSRHFPF